VSLQPTNTPADPHNNSSGFGDIYLTNWRLLRGVSGPTVQSDGSQWTENIYRHPNLQGLQMEERYNIGHDVYSLGVRGPF